MVVLGRFLVFWATTYCIINSKLYVAYPVFCMYPACLPPACLPACLQLYSKCSCFLRASVHTCTLAWSIQAGNRTGVHTQGILKTAVFQEQPVSSWAVWCVGWCCMGVFNKVSVLFLHLPIQNGLCVVLLHVQLFVDKIMTVRYCEYKWERWRSNLK